MVDATRALLDELMGKDRDVPLNDKDDRPMKFSDRSVCKYQLAGLCPNKLFKNTKSDLGACIFEIHDDHIEWDKIQSQWDALDDREKLRYGYERDLLRLLEQHIRDMDKKIAKAKERAEKESAPRELKSDEKTRLTEIQQKVKEALEKSQQLGEDGDVDGSMVFAQQAETLQQQYDNLQKTLTQPERTMTVCEVCGVFINSTDNEQRRKDHLNGKQYIGWKKIRDAHEALQEKFDKVRKERDASRERAREDRPERADRPERPERPERADRADRRDRDRDRDRERRHNRERSRSRGSRRRDRDRERERGEGERSRERYREGYHRRFRSRSPRGYKNVPPPDEMHRSRRKYEDHFGY